MLQLESLPWRIPLSNLFINLFFPLEPDNGQASTAETDPFNPVCEAHTPHAAHSLVGQGCHQSEPQASSGIAARARVRSQLRYTPPSHGIRNAQPGIRSATCT